jgi:pyridoxal phosphate enzyme (YggS family)
MTNREASATMSTARRVLLAANLAAVRRRIAAACATAGRKPDEIALIAVTKTFPASDVRLLAELGVRDVGENRDQEAAAKAAACAGLGVRWHFIGQLQTNKARSVASYAHVVHSVDRLRLVAALDQAAQQAQRRLTCLVQVDLDPNPSRHGDRGGAVADIVPALADAIAGSAALDLGGVMGIAPLALAPLALAPKAAEAPEAAEAVRAAAAAFERLASVAAQLRRNHPHAAIVSAGMSDDMEAAIAAGATHLRVGTAVLGVRPSLG